MTGLTKIDKRFGTVVNSNEMVLFEAPSALNLTGKIPGTHSIIQRQKSPHSRKANKLTRPNFV